MNIIKKLRAKFIVIILLLTLPFISLELYGEQPPSQRERGGGSPPAIGVVKGELLDEQADQPLMYASVVLYRERDSVMVTGAISDEDGRFIIEEVPPGQYYVKVQFVGYPTQKYNGIRITPREPVYDAGLIKISPTAEYLSEVVIESTREMMEVGLDRRVINVGQELTAAGGTALELMQNIPSVSVDFEGNVSLRGSQNVTILVDGKPSTLTGLDNETVLEQIPSEMIERIEVITNPSVRYDPDGTAGIINIVTKKEERPGYNGMINLSAGTNNRYSGSVNFNYRPSENINFFGNASGRFFNMEGWGKSNRTSWFPGSDLENETITSHLDQDMEFDRSMNTYNLQLGFDYTFNDKNNITFSTRYSTWERNNDAYQDYMFTNSRLPRYSSDYIDYIEDISSGSVMMRGGFDYSLRYQREFDEEYRDLTLDLRYSDSHFDREESLDRRFYDHSYNELGLPELLEETFNDGDHYNFMFEADYVHPFNETSKFEAGFQTIFRGSDNKFSFYQFDHDVGELVLDPNRTDHFIMDEQRYSAYGIYSTALGNYNVQAGLRLEHAVLEGDQVVIDDGDFRNEYFSYFPSAHVRRSFENNQNVQLSYSKRISRPRRWALNPFTRYSDPYNLSTGNPKILPEYIHSFELGYTKFWENTTLNPSVFYRYTDQMISRYRTMDDEGVTITTWENIGHAINYGAELIASQTITDWWRVNGNFSYFHRIVDGGTVQDEYTADSYSWTARITNNFRFGNKLSAQLSGNYRSPVVMLQGELKEMYSADMGLRYNVLDNKGSITLRVSDIFNTSQFNMFTMGDNFEMTSERKRRSRMIFLGFTYRIHDFSRDRDRMDRDQMEPMDEFDEF